MSKVTKAPTDFNDVHNIGGLDAVRAQIMPVVEQLRSGSAINDSAPDPELSPDDNYYESLAENSPHPSTPEVAAPTFTIEKILQRFAFAMPNGKIWDAHKRIIMKKTVLKELIGAELFKEWMSHADRKVVDEHVVKRAETAAPKEGERGLYDALDRFVYLYPETSVWDTKKRKVVSCTGLKVAIADCYDDWIKHPNRKEIDIENLVFDPTQKVDPDTHINMFRGLAIEPAETSTGCSAIKEMVYFLCNGYMGNDAAAREADEGNQVYWWLVRWLAYPLQNMGAKMATAVMMHSEVQGSGKSLFFDKVMRGIYGEYSGTLGQHQLESPYTDWRSQMLYGVFEEIFSRDQKYSHTGTLKQMITGETMRIEKKFVSGWEEANHMNGVFLSNEIQPFPIDPTDRRMLVIWPEGKLSIDLRDRVLAEINNGGIQAFYRWLLDLDLKGFHTHFEPPMTGAKERLIDFGRSGWDSFYREWQTGALGVPYGTCLLSDLYKVYKSWCRDGNEKVLSMKAFSSFLSVPSRGRRRPDCHYTLGVNKHKGTFLQIGSMPEKDGLTQSVWFGRCVEEFREKMGVSFAD